jgi:hypothetical protein
MLLAPECLATFQKASTNTRIRAAVSAGFNTSREAWMSSWVFTPKYSSNVRR